MPKSLGTGLAVPLQCCFYALLWISFPGITSYLLSPAWMIPRAYCLPEVGKAPGFSSPLEMLLMPQEGARAEFLRVQGPGITGKAQVP